MKNKIEISFKLYLVDGHDIGHTVVICNGDKQSFIDAAIQLFAMYEHINNNYRQGNQ